MKSKAYASILAIVFLAFLTGCGGSNSTPATITITATSGSGQSAVVDTTFGTTLSATVMQGTNPVSGATVTFAAPVQTEASGTFAGGATTATTNASGVATSVAFTANTIAGSYVVGASTSGATTVAGFTLTNTAGPAATITATSGGGQSAWVGAQFTNPLVATVVDSYGNPVSGATVTFTAPASGASGTFSGSTIVTGSGTAIATVTTTAAGVASATFTAATAAGTYAVTAAVTGLTTANFTSLTNTVKNYAFFLSGLEAINETNQLPNYYALAGSVTIDANGNVLGGEQDYNDAYGITATDTIAAGTAALNVNTTTGQGTLSLNTGNTALGVIGVETLGVQFVNANHALIVQFDGSATSSGSMDLQTLPSTLSGNYAFTLSGPGSKLGGTLASGGVFSISGTTLQGVFDINDSAAAAPVLGTTFSGTISAADNFGRGTITGTNLMGGTPTALAYYIVGPEAIRIIDVDTTDSGVGSAFGQGTGTFSNSSLGSPVFGIASNSWQGPFYAAAGMFTTDSGAGTFTGVADDDENGTVVSPSPSTISGTYSISNSIGGTVYNGYGSLTITNSGLGVVSALGIYMTDPTLNLLDPNNMSGFSGGGALIADMDILLVGTGVLIPQTDTNSAHFTNSYAFGAQDYNGLNPSSNGWEFDFVGQGLVTDLALNGTGLLSDPFLLLDLGKGTSTYSGVAFTGTAVADASNAGRYTIPLKIDTGVGSALDLSVVIYQVSGGQLFSIDLDESPTGTFLGSLQQQGSLTGLPVPAVKKAAAKNKTKQKP